MTGRIKLSIQTQPDEITCGPTCLQAVYQYYDDYVPLEDVVREVHMLEEGGTLAVLLGCHALRRGYKVWIYTYNLQVFDPTWFASADIDLAAKLEEQLKFKKGHKLKLVSKACLEFLQLGGEIRFQDLTTELIRGYLLKGLPILAGLSATYLYKSSREYGLDQIDDDIRGEPQGHFVVMTGIDFGENIVTIVDPYSPNPVSVSNEYRVSMQHLVCSILLGIVTYDANLLIITK